MVPSEIIKFGAGTLPRGLSMPSMPSRPAPRLVPGRGVRPPEGHGAGMEGGALNASVVGWEGYSRARINRGYSRGGWCPSAPSAPSYSLYEPRAVARNFGAAA